MTSSDICFHFSPPALAACIIKDRNDQGSELLTQRRSLYMQLQKALLAAPQSHHTHLVKEVKIVTYRCHSFRIGIRILESLPEWLPSKFRRQKHSSEGLRSGYDIINLVSAMALSWLRISSRWLGKERDKYSHKNQESRRWPLWRVRIFPLDLLRLLRRLRGLRNRFRLGFALRPLPAYAVSHSLRHGARSI